MDKAKELGRLLSVEAIIVGNYTVLDKTIKLTAKALDANTGFIVAASMKDLLIDNDAGALLGINVSLSGGSNSSRGFNNPLNSNEQINNPETVNKECETKNVGDFCFENRSLVKVDVYIDGDSDSRMTLDSGQTQCYYNIKTGNHGYGYFLSGRNNYIGKGQVLVEKCKSKTFTIK